MVALRNPLNNEIITAAERAAANIKLGCDAAFDACTKAGEVTASRKAPLAKAKEYLARARGHWARAKQMGASAEQLAALEGFGRAAAKAVAEAEARAAAPAPNRAEKVRRAMMLKGKNAYEAAVIAADSMVAQGLADDRVAGMRAVVEISGHLALATTDAVLAAWLQLAP